MNIFLRQHAFPILILTVVVLTVFSFMVTDSFKTLDDDFAIVRNETIKDPARAGELLTTSYFGGNAYYRPLVMLSYMAEHHFFGLNAFYYYVDNILIHILTSLIAYFLLLALLRDRWPALGAALLFAVHPVQWEAVSNVPGRAILLCALFSTASLLCYVLYRTGRVTGRAGVRTFVASWLFLFPALMSKESAVTVPVIMLAFEFWASARLCARARRWLNTVPYFIIIAGFYLFRRALGITQLFFWRNLGETALGFLTFLRSVLTYLRIFFVPHDLHFDRSRMLYQSFFDPGLLATAAVFGLGVFLFWRARRLMNPMFKFFCAWFFIELFPVSQLLVSIGTQPYYISTAEHFLYTALIGPSALLAMAGHRLYRLNMDRRKVSHAFFLVMVAAVYVYFAVWTVQYNIYSTQEIAMCERCLRYNPANVRIRNSLAFFYAKKGNFPEAEKHFRRSLTVEPWNVRARIGLAKSLADQGHYWDSLEEYDKVIGANESMAELAHDNRLATVRLVIPEYLDRLIEEPDNPKLNYTLGVLYSQSGDPESAVVYFEKAVMLKPGFPEALFNLASVHESLQNWQRAADGYEELLALGRDDIPEDLYRHALTHLAGIHEMLGNHDKARAYRREAEPFGP